MAQSCWFLLCCAVSRTCLWLAPSSTLKYHMCTRIYLAVKSPPAAAGVPLLVRLWCWPHPGLQPPHCCYRSLLCRNNVQREQREVVPRIASAWKEQGLPCSPESSPASLQTPLSSSEQQLAVCSRRDHREEEEDLARSCEASCLNPLSCLCQQRDGLQERICPAGSAEFCTSRNSISWVCTLKIFPFARRILYPVPSSHLVKKSGVA